MDNYANFAGCANSMDSLHITENERRCAIFEMNNKYIKNGDYFNRLASTFTQLTGNALYTYLRTPGFFPIVPLNEIPTTTIKQTMKELSQSRPIQFIEEIKSGDYKLPYAQIFVVGGELYISVSDLYANYKDWFKENIPSGNVCNNAKFGNEINSSDMTTSERKTKPGCGTTRCRKFNRAYTHTITLAKTITSKDGFKTDMEYPSILELLNNPLN